MAASCLLKNSSQKVKCLFKKHIVLVRCMRSGRSDATKRNTSLIPVTEIVAQPVGFSHLLKPFAFTVSFCGLSFAGAMIWQYEGMRNRFYRWPNVSWKKGKFRRGINDWWNSNTEGQKVAWTIIWMNAAVFLLWKVPGLTPTMMRYFCSNPASKSVCLPMILSTFSHFSLFHFAANMMVLYSFSTTVVTLFGKEQFVALYLSAGVLSSFASYVHKIGARSLNPSLGASGALMAIIAACCFQFPDAQLTILFLPFLSLPAGTTMKALMGLDALGLALRWRVFDHAAHLGGAFYGVLYTWYGKEYIWDKRGLVMQWWHDARNSSSSSFSDD